MGDFHSFPNEHSIREICRLPFKTCWFESGFVNEHGQLETVCIFVSADLPAGPDGNRGVVQVWTRGGRFGREGWAFGSMATPMDADLEPSLRLENARWACYPDAPIIQQQTAQVLHILYRYLTLINCTNVVRTEHRPDAALQRARAKRGKKPLFSYWTLELQPDRSEGAHLGGTHTSPRLHLRRGHPRQYAPGKYTWVQPHVVGNKSLGMIHKDYDGSKLSPVGRTLQ